MGDPVTTSDSAPHVESRGLARPAAALLATAGVAMVWVAAIALQPETTYHLAPALVMGAYPALRWGALASPGRRVIAVVVGATIASAIAVVLQWGGLLDGPALVGTTGFEESLLVIAGATVAGLVEALATGFARDGHRR
jgi:cation transport ATPase